MPQQRKDDAVIEVINGKIDDIHLRLDKIEDLSNDFKEIKEWIATVVKVTQLLEILGCFMAKWAASLGLFAGAVASIYISIKTGIKDAIGLFR